MARDSSYMRLFGVTQIALLIAIAGALYFHWKRTKERKKAQGLTLDSVYIRDSIRRTPVNQGAQPRLQQQGTPADEQADPLKVESALPTWTKDTPAHEILGIAATAGQVEVEDAYKKLLKRYHPDRFAAWGKGYQNRAHHVILLIQEARDKMLRKRH